MNENKDNIQKIVDDIRSAIKSSAMQSYDKIKDICKMFE